MPPSPLEHPSVGRRLTLGWQEASRCWRLIGDDPSLLVLPGLTVLLYSATWGVLYLLTSFVVSDFALRMLLVGIVGAYPYAFSGTFFGVAFVAVVDGRLQGRPVSIRQGLRVAQRKLPAIAKWSLVASGVGVVLQLLQHVKSDWVVTQIMSFAAGVGWTVLTFFVVPVLAFEEAGVRDTLKRSSAIIRKRWGEGVGGVTNIGMAAGVAMLMVAPITVTVIAVGFTVGQAAGFVAIGLVALFYVAALVAVDAAGRLLTVVLYRFATAGDQLGGFTSAELSGAVRRKRRWRPWPRH